MNEDFLDNPIWHALQTGNRDLAIVKGGVRFFSEDVSPFAAMADYHEINLKELYDALPEDRAFAIFSLNRIHIPAYWSLLEYIPVFQMVHSATPAIESLQPLVVPLTVGHIQEMIQLTQLTKPGPFFDRTIEFGHYEGIFDHHQLVSMAGQRLHAGNFIEISAVCTHPDYLGRGYAGRLLDSQVNRIITEGGIPFLHVRNDNSRAVKRYQSSGFSIRKQLNIYLIEKNVGSQ